MFKPAETLVRGERVIVELEGPTAPSESLSRMDQRLITHLISARAEEEQRRGTGEKE